MGKKYIQTIYSPLSNFSFSRVHRTNNSFIKTFLLNYGVNRKKFANEIFSYRRLANENFIPKLLTSKVIKGIGYLEISSIDGINLNQLNIESKLHLIDSSEIEIIFCKIIINLQKMIKANLYWNDLSLHNMIIKNGDLYFIDFSECAQEELNDHVAMLTWIFHDFITIGQNSYQMGVYANIHDTGSNFINATQSNRFITDETQIPQGISWIYSFLIKLSKIDDLLRLPKFLNKKLEAGSQKKLSSF